jgi:hypothetical protein
MGENPIFKKMVQEPAFPPMGKLCGTKLEKPAE